MAERKVGIREQAKKRITRSLSSVRQSARRSKISSLELERASREIAIVGARLDSGEYRKTSFQKNLLNIVDRTAELHSDLRFLCSVGRIWEQIFRSVGISHSGNILDLGCGYFPKVELGLYYAGYNGSV